jgi:ABC-type branched-subunit amino acid transport system ATPase component
MPEHSACLSVHDLALNFGGLRAVDRVSFEVRTGAVHGLIGPNGAGKTTIFSCVTGFYRPTSGRIRFLEHDVTHLRPDQVAHLGIARTFQNVQLFPSLSVLDNVLVAKHGHMRTGVLAEGLGLRSVRTQEPRRARQGADAARPPGAGRRPAPAGGQPAARLPEAAGSWPARWPWNPGCCRSTSRRRG